MATTIEKLVDCFDTKIGDTQIARGGVFSRTISQEDIESWGDGVAGAQAIDAGPVSIAAELRCGDPLVVPTVAALTWPLLIGASGRVKGSTTLRRLGVLHAMLTGMSLEINDNAGGSATFSFRNRAVLGGSTTLAAEAPTSTPTSIIVPTRRNTIKILSASFTPIGGAAVTVRGITRLSWQFQGTPMGSTATPGSDIDDEVDVGSLKFSGSIDCEDFALTANLPMPLYLTTLKRGTLALTCRQAGQDDDASPPANVIISLPRLKFRGAQESANTKADGKGGISFNQTMAQGGTVYSLGDMIAAA